MSNDINTIAAYMIRIENQIRQTGINIAKELKQISLELQRINNK